jgi:hypothetical protein
MLPEIGQLDEDKVSAVVAVMSALAGVVMFVVAKAIPWLRAKLASRSLAKHFDSQEYHPDVLLASVKHYVPHHSTAVDPAGREDYRALHPVTSPLFEVLDRALERKAGPKHLLLLADSGMGKTSALINYYARNLRRWHGRVQMEMFYLGRADVLERMARVAAKSQKVLLLDALDEDPRAIEDHSARIREIMGAAAEFKAVIITCRSQFFYRDEEITQGHWHREDRPSPTR